VEADELALEQIRVRRAHARIDQALPRENEVRGRQFALLAAESGVVREIDAGTDADCPDATVGRYLRHARRDTGHVAVRPCEVIPDVERVEDPRLHRG